MPSSDYTSVPSTGKLKLKGVSSDAKIAKKKKKHRSDEPKVNKEQEESKSAPEDESSFLSKALNEEDKELEAGRGGDAGGEGKEVWRGRGKTEAEKRWEEQRRQRLDDRLKREGVKSHKERVEELNRYLSKLSEHHDMPKIGPG